jgi:uncharacterized membrane protein
MKDQAEAPRFERRWPVALAILTVLLLLAVLPGRIRVFPAWFPYVIAIVVLLPMAIPRFAGVQSRWARIERWTTVLFFLVAMGGTLGGLTYLIRAMVNRPADVSGLELFESSIAVWFINVLIFSLLYWQMDRGGPEARAKKEGTRPDWLFPQEGAPAEDVPPGWRPAFVDYLFLSYSTATAFSTTDVMPLTSRAKLLMMLESTISLATIVVVAARAINILGS